MALLPSPLSPLLHRHLPLPNPNANPNPNPNPNCRAPFLRRRSTDSHWQPRGGFLLLPAIRAAFDGRHESTDRSPPLLPSALEAFRRHSPFLLNLVASTVFFIGFGARACTLGSTPIPPPTVTVASENHAAESCDTAAGRVEDEELRAALESWKSKVYALTVPLRIVALRGSIPPSWIKDFIQVQGRRLKLSLEFCGSLECIFSDLSSASDTGRLQPKSAMAADIVSVGDSWLNYAICRGLIEPMKHVEEQDWFKNLSSKWKSYLRRNEKGELDSNGYIWGVPYRWGTMVIAYKKSKFRKHNLRPIEDWADLWRPELAGKISMVGSPREVVGVVLKHMGASYNTEDIESQVNGGKEAVLNNLTMLQRQVRLFDSIHYLKAFGAGDVWVAIGWSSDVIPVAKRMSNVAVVVPKSGTSLWTDLWVVPYAARFKTEQIGGRIRGPSPLIYQWLEFCLQTARQLPFQQEIVPGASPLALDRPVEGARESTRGKPKLDTNLIDGVPPPDILAKCEFLEPLSGKALEDLQWLISNLQKPGCEWVRIFRNYTTWVFKLHWQ